MCGRFTLKASPQQLAWLLGAPVVGAVEPRYNIAPGQQVLTVRHLPDECQRQFAFLEWGLVPYWADEPEIGHRHINARCETLASKASFRIPLKKRRCLIVADGFYEWQQAGKWKRPYLIRLKGERPFAFAGLWDRWQGNGAEIESCAVITTDANELVRPIHDRMPAILSPTDFDLWLDPAVQDAGRLQPLLVPFPVAGMVAVSVSTLVNDPGRDVHACAEPLASLQNFKIVRSEEDPAG